MLVNKLDEFLKPDAANGLRTANAYELRNIMLNVIERHIEKKLRTRKLLDEIRGLTANA